MKFCSECGFKLEGNEKICPKCGNKFKSSLFDNLGKDTRKFIDDFDGEVFVSDVINKVGDFSLFDVPRIVNDSSKFIYENISLEDVQDFTKDVSNKFKRSTKQDESNLKKARKAFNKEGFFNSVYSDEKRYSNIIEMCDKVITIDETNYEAYFLKGASLFYLKRYDEAIMSLSKSLTLNYDNMDYKLFLAESYRLSGSLNDSSKLYESIIVEYPNNPRILKGKALLHYDIKDYVQSNFLFNNAYNLDVNIFNDNDYFIWGLCLQNLNLHFDAQNKFEKAYLINKSSKYHATINDNRRYIFNNSNSSFELYDVALKFFNEHNYEESLNYLNKALKIKNNDVKITSLICKCELYLADYINALKYCNTLLSLEKTLNNYNLKTEILMGLKDYAAALKCYNDSLVMGEHAIMNANVGFIHYFLGDEESADNYFNKSLNISYNSRASIGKALTDTDKSDIYIDSAFKYGDGLIDEILINCIQNALKWDTCVKRIRWGPSSGQMRLIDEVHVFERMFKECNEYLDNAYDSFKKWKINKYFWMSNFGFRLIEKRFFDLSRNNYHSKAMGVNIDWNLFKHSSLKHSWSYLGDILIKIYGENVYYFIEQGKIYNTFGDEKQALPKFDKALEFCSDELLRYDIYSYQAQTYKNGKKEDLMRQHFNKAIEGYDNLLKNNPNDVDLLIRKALNFAQMGDKGEALALFNRVLEIDPNNDNAKRGIRNIDNF